MFFFNFNPLDLYYRGYKIDLISKYLLVYTVSKKLCQFYFLNNSVKH